MAITVSAEFKAIWEQKQGKADHMRLRYKRRYKIGTTYYSEADWSVLERSEFCSIGAIPQQSDVRRNIIKTSVMTLKMPNENNQWIEHAGSPSFWAADNVATNGYKATRTLWQVQQGYELASGSIEWISVFTGIQMKLPKITGTGEYALIEVSSKAVLLEKADAEEVSEEPGLENCSPATGDGSDVTFESTSTGVDHAKLFEVNGANLTQGSQWRVSNDNEIASAGNTGKLLITAATAPTAGHTVKTSVRRWYKDQTVEYLEGLLCDEAGITSADRSISAVLFPGGLSGSKTITDQADWEAGTVLTNVSATVTPGSIVRKWFTIDTFADNEFTSSPVWTKGVDTGGTTGADASAGDLQVYSTHPGGGRIAYYTPFTKATGSWDLELKFRYFNDSKGFFWFLCESTPNDPTTGYAIAFNQDNTDKVQLVKNKTTVLADLGSITYDAYATWRITRSSAGEIKVYKNTVLTATVTDTDYTVGGYLVIMAESGVVTSYDALVGLNAAYHSEDVTTAAVSVSTTVFESAVQDILSTPTAWGTLDIVETLNSGTITYATASSSDNISYDAYVNISGGVIQSALKRYFKVKATIAPASGSYTSPAVASLVANFTTSTVNVSLANHRGRTVMQQLEQYVKLADYELRFKGDGTLVIAAKTSGSYVVHLTQENGIIDVLEVDYGIPERVVRAGRVRYQGFVSVYGDSEASATAETIADGDELGKTVIDEDLSNVLVANDVNIGTSRARVLYDNNRRSATDPRPLVRIRLRIWDVPWIEVSDVIRVDFYDHPLLATLQANDELLRADSPYFHMGAPGNVISAAKDWRVLYYNPNKDTGTAEILAEEVL